MKFFLLLFLVLSSFSVCGIIKPATYGASEPATFLETPQLQLGIGLEANWVKNVHSQKNFLQAKRRGVNIIKTLRDRGFGHLVLSIGDEIVKKPLRV